VSDQFQTSSVDDQTSETTQLLRAWADGDQRALERLTPHVYRTLRHIAGYQMRDERAGHSMQATTLVHEAYLELIDVTNVNWQHRAHFFAVSAQIMRHILLDRARRPMGGLMAVWWLFWALSSSNATRYDLHALTQSAETSTKLLQNRGVLNVFILRQQQHLRNNFCSLWIIVCKREKQSSAVLRVNRNDA
jgi:ECF sigma factor